ncbi:MAG: hypothetical protein ABSH08_09205 [Tepidisphaeraceae bacterium]|jgi:hypothetical protein
MTAFASINFPCPDCGALFALTPQVAARKIQCPCGRVFMAPPMPQLPPDPEPYAIDTKPVESVSPSASSGAAEGSGSTLRDLYPHRSIASLSTDDLEPEFSLARDRVIPIVLLVAGLALRVGEMPFDRTLDHTNLAEGLAVMAFQIVLAVALMLAGVLAASKILATNFGPVGTAALKLAGMSIFALAAGAAVVILLQYNIRAFIMAIHLIFIIYAVTFWTLFSLDVQEAVLTVAICALLQNAATLVIFSSGK